MLALLLLVTLPVAPPGVMVDRIVAVVDEEVITQSELLVEARLALAMRRGGAAASGPMGPELLEGLRVYLIHQTLVAALARRVGAAEVPELEVQAELHRLERRFASRNAYRAFLRRFGISSSTVRSIVRRDVRNQRYIDQQMRSRLLWASDSDGADAGQRYDATLSAWLDELRANADIRLLGPEGNLERQHVR